MKTTPLRGRHDRLKLYVPEDFYPEYDKFFQLLELDDRIPIKKRRTKHTMQSYVIRGLIRMYNSSTIKYLIAKGLLKPQTNETSQNVQVVEQEVQGEEKNE